jgi:Arc/MetJ family transcription regulator
MRTNIVIDDKLMADVMAMGGFKTKREAVEEGLRMLKRRKAYDALLAARGTLHWDDSDEHWAKVRAEREAQAETNSVHEPVGPYVLGQGEKP